MLIFSFQHFILRFNKISLLYGYPWKKGLGWKKALKDRVSLQIIFVFTLTRLKTFIWGRVSVFDEIYTFLV
jgi:hypothetical protein